MGKAVTDAAGWAARFWRRLDPQDAQGCRRWGAVFAHDRRGRGVVDVPVCVRPPGTSRTWAAHRVAWLLLRGDPDRGRVMQTCGVPDCCAPRHLRLIPAPPPSPRAGEDAMRLRAARWARSGGELAEAARIVAELLRRLRAN